MEPDEVLREFIELCNSQSGFFQCHLAQNAALEWFGRTIRGGSKVYQYYRYDLCQQYTHYFQNAQRCDPIETKATHMQTKQIPIADTEKRPVDDVDCRRAVIEFTPTQYKFTPELPAVTQGRKFLPINDDDDLTDLGLANIQDEGTPPQNNTKPLKSEEPVLKKMKYSSKESVSSKNSEEGDQINQQSSTHSQYVEDSVEQVKNESVSKNSINSKNEEDNCEKKADTVDVSQSNSYNYSELMYIESIGTLRMCKKTKHRGVSSGGTNISTETRNTYWDRETKIKISYRIRQDNQQIQFALIIYEHITRNPITRRNLLVEFQKADDDATKSAGKKSKPPEIKRKVPLNRTLRLF